MARKSRYRRYRRGRWSSNITELNHIALTFASGESSATATLVTNPAQSNLSTSQTYTVKNIELNYLMEGNPTNTDNINVYIMFVPQGMNVSSDYNIQHPEYIMAHRMQGNGAYNNQQYFQPLRIKTRLARRLNTGDSIILFIKMLNSSNSDEGTQLNGIVKWWSKAN